MSSTTTTSGKAFNRLRQQLADIQLGRLPDVGERHPKGFRFRIGRLPDGQGARFWLGSDELQAQQRAAAYVEAWADVIRRGGTSWSDETLKEARDLGEQRIRGWTNWANSIRRGAVAVAAVAAQEDAKLQAVTAQPVASAAETPTETPMLHAAIDTYMVAFKAKATSESHKERTRQLLDDLKHYRADVPLATIDRVWLQTLTDFIKSRPKARKRKTPLAPLTVRNTLRAWSRFFDWIDSNADSPRFGHWQAPRRCGELFQVRLTKLMTKAERDAHADGPKQLTIDQVVRLYRAAKNDVHGVCVLLGTFAALGQKEIATLRRDEFDLDAGVLTHRRSKTGQLGKFWLPPEAVKIVRRYFRDVRTDKENTAFFTGDGSKLVTDSSDAVRQAWTDIVNRVNKEDGPKIAKGMQGFYALRKFAADYAMRTAGPVVRDTFLAHAPESVGAKHYSNSRNFDDVFAVGKALHAELVAKGMFKPTPKAKVKPVRKAA
jgi:integrase